jgi:diguanylate cyclase (GGDEF)-like protein
MFQTNWGKPMPAGAVKNIKIGKKIASLVALSVFSAMILLAIFLGFTQLKNEVQQKRSALETTAFIYASALADDIYVENRQGVQQTLRSISRLPVVLHASAINSKGRTIASMGNVTYLTTDQASSDPGMFELLSKGNLPVSVDIVKGGEPVGRLLILGDIHDIKSNLFRTLLGTLIASVVAALLAFPISAPLRSRIVNPIVSLTTAMKRMRETRTFETATIVGAEGETRVLVETFNSMIGDIHQRDASLRKLAYFDPLTGLPNRANFQRNLEELFQDGNLKPSAFFIFDIDNFHAINDALGHGIGDALLMDVAARLHSEIPEGSSIARLGGDEFAVHIPNINNFAEAQNALAILIATLYAPLKFLDHEIHVSAACGAVLVPQDATTPSQVQRQLDLALHDAKKAGVGRVSFFRKELIDVLTQEADLVKGLRVAIDENKLTAHFQPVINLDTGYVEGFEALARWNDPIKGFISPAQFIPAAEKSGLISTLGTQILKIACKQAKLWKDAGKPDWTVAVNVSAAQILQAGFIDQVREILEETQVPPHLLCLELTESLFVGKSMAIVQTMLREFRILGIKTALDDFGTGYSSLSYLEHLPFDKLKIDRAFVHNAQEGTKNTELLKGIINLAHGLGMIVVAEGAETQVELDMLRQLKADCVQGYVIAKPMPAEQATITADLYDQQQERAKLIA